MNLEQLAAQHGGFWSTPVTIRGTDAKPQARIAFLNQPENSVGLEIRGEAVLLVGEAAKN